MGKKKIVYNYTSQQGCSGTASKSFVVVDTVGNICTVTKYDTVKVVNTITKYDTVKITKTYVDTIKVNKTIYDTIQVKKTIFDTIIVKNVVNDTLEILKIKIKITSGVNTNKLATISVYPNPTTDLLIIESEDFTLLSGYSIKITDLLSKELYNKSIVNSKTEIQMNSLGSNGVYTLSILDSNGQTVESRKILLEK